MARPFDVLVEPGDKEAVVELEDSLGNKQTSSIVIGGIQGPTLAVAGQGSIIAGGLPPAPSSRCLRRMGHPVGERCRPAMASLATSCFG